MSVFSKLRRSKQAAKEHKAKQAEKESEPAKVPYRHVPTHAANDALNGTPGSWKAFDKPKIREQNRRRSQMIISRTPSTLSTMTLANTGGPSTSTSALPRNSSYHSYSPAWFDRPGERSGLGRESYFSQTSQEPAQTRHRSTRGQSYHDSAALGRSPLSNSPVDSEGNSPVGSSGNSTNSQSSDHLEIGRPANARRHSHTPERRGGPDRQPQKPVGNLFVEKDVFDRLHTSTTRKLGEAPLYDSPPPRVPKTTVTEVKSQPKRQRWSLMGKKPASAIAV